MTKIEIFSELYNITATKNKCRVIIISEIDNDEFYFYLNGGKFGNNEILNLIFKILKKDINNYELKIEWKNKKSLT